MDLSALPQIVDADGVRSRVASIALHVRLGIITSAAGIAYAFAAHAEGHRPVIVALLTLRGVWLTLPLVAGAERLVRSSSRERLLLGWSLGSIVLIASVTALDGGARSPLALLFFVPIAHAALSYPLPAVVTIGAADVFAFVGVGVIAGTPQAYLAFFTTCLASIALLCAWAASDHDRQRAALARVSRTDPLTGCLNRRGFEERLDAELDTGLRTGGSCALVTLDLDDFKAVNDSRGHAAGDALLRWTVERAQSVLRPMDSLGRMGGDEFAILVPGAGPAEAREVAARVTDALRERVSVSSGIACFPVHGRTRDALHRHADAGLYGAKHERARMPLLVAS